MKRVLYFVSEQDRLNLTLCESDNLHVFLVGIGENKGKFTLSAELGGDANLVVDSLLLLTNDSDFYFDYSATHVGKKSTSSFQQVCCLDDSARKKTSLKIHFLKGCFDAIGNEKEECYLLSSKTNNACSPAIFCDEEKVIGTHSMSSGHFDEKQIEYLMSRGYSLNTAKKTLLYAKFQNIINSMKKADQVKVRQELMKYGY